MATITDSKFISDSSISPFLLFCIRLGLTFSILVPPIPVLSASAPWTGFILGKEIECGERSQGYGPYDYLQRKKLSYNLHLVEGAHFTAKVESLESGQSGAFALMGDLDYTLRAWPNHHRALTSLMRYTTQKKGIPDPGYPPFECYLQRAIHFSPKDMVPSLLYALYLHKLGYREKALQQYKDVENLSPDNPELHYNLGLLLVNLKKYEEAKSYAQKAYQAGYPLPGLKRQLTELGYWRDQ